MKKLIIAILLLSCSSAFAGGMITIGKKKSSGPEILDPNAGGTIGWTLWDGGSLSADHYGDMADSSDSTYAYASTTTKSERLGFTDSTLGEGIVNVKVCGRLKTDGGTGNVRLFGYSNTSYGYSSYFIPETSGYTEYCHTMTTDPNGGSAWTQSGMNSATFGVQTHTTTFSDTAYISKLWIEVTR